MIYFIHKEQGTQKRFPREIKSEKEIKIMMKNAIRTINDTEAQVTKAFAKKAVIFGTEEYKLWKAYRQDFPEATMVTKTIKKKANKKVETRNMKYENMAAYIRTLDDAEEQMAKFEKAVKQSKVQANPYRFVLAWFQKTYEGYDAEYKAYFEKLRQEQEEEESIFKVAV